MKMKKTIALLSAAGLVLSAAPTIAVPVSAASAVSTVTSGQAGPNATWTLDSATKTLTISGSGRMYDYDFSPSNARAPWCANTYRASIEHAIISGVSNVGASAFACCENLKTVQINATVHEIGENAFRMDNLTELRQVIIPEGVTRIGDNAFRHCNKLSSIVLPDSLGSIGYAAFSGCYEMNEVNLSGNLEYIGAYAFQFCKNLKKVEIPESSVPNSNLLIGISAFQECERLQEVTIFRKNHTLEDFRTARFECPFYRNTTVYTYPDSQANILYNYCKIADLDQDSDIDATDAIIELNVAADLMVGNDSGEYYENATDIDADGEISVADAQYILNYYMQNTVMGNPTTWYEILHPDET